jgi:uncharacterized membrane protein YdbT with pleckstrin-like domain
MTNPFSEPQPAPAAEAAATEKTLWEGRPSQIINLPLYLLCGLFAGALLGGAFLLARAIGNIGWALTGAIILPLAVALSRWLRTRCLRFELTTERLLVSRGVFSRRTDEVELYRVKDYTLIEPLALRLCGLGHIVVTTTDDANLRVVLRAVPDVRSLRDQIRKHVELRRDEKRVRVSEFEE